MSSVGNNTTPGINVVLYERDIIKLMLDFLQQRKLYISMFDLERETGIINESFSENILLIRQLIAFGQWDQVIDCAQQWKEHETFDDKQFTYIILKYQFLELVCLILDGRVENDACSQQIKKYLDDLRPFAPDEQEYEKLSSLLSLKRLQDHIDYRNWNPSAGRVKCFAEVYPLLCQFLNTDKRTPIAQGDRLLQLLVKGLMYESCVEHCQARATNSYETIDLANPNSLLSNTIFSDTDGALLSWLHTLPTETFSYPFEQQPLVLRMDKLQQPSLEATWSGHILDTPFRPGKAFPFNAKAPTRPRSIDLIARILAPKPVSGGLPNSPASSTKPKFHEIHRQQTVSSALFPDVKRTRFQDSRQASLPATQYASISPKTQLTSTTIDDSGSQSSPDPSVKKYKTHEDIIKEYGAFTDKTIEPSKPSSSNQRIRAANTLKKQVSFEQQVRSPTFAPLVFISDAQAIRSVDIHPSGNYFAIGSKSKVLRVCAYPDIENLPSPNSEPSSAKVLLQKQKYHAGSIYCIGWSPSGRLIATGSNDTLIKILQVDMERLDSRPNNTAIELNHHDGIVRDLIFMNDDSTLISGGERNYTIYVTDINTQTPIKSYNYHRGAIYSLHAWNVHNFVAASADGTSSIWDLREATCIHAVAALPSNSGAASVAVNNARNLLAAGYEDASCLLYDLRQRRVLQVYQPHSHEIHSVRFSTKSHYLLTASYDKKVNLTDLNGDLTKPLVMTNIATHNDKIIQARWHPYEMSFVTASADQKCIVWVSQM